MSAPPSSTTHGNTWAGRWDGGPPDSTDVVSDLRSRLLRIAVLPVAAMALLGVLAASLLAADRSVGTRYLTLVGALVGTVLVAIMAASWAAMAARAIHEHIDQSTHDADQWISDLRSSMARGQEEIQRLGIQIRDG